MADDLKPFAGILPGLPVVHEAEKFARPLTQHKVKFLQNVQRLQEQTPKDIEPLFLAKYFVLATLPHRDPGDVPIWKRVNGTYTLSIRSGWNNQQDRPYGYPYGTIPRLLLYWITTEARRTQSPRLELGSTLAEFMRELGLDPQRGGSRSDAARLREQMRRLFNATISFQQSETQSNRICESWLNMQVAPEGMLWWDVRQPEQSCLFESWIELSSQFFRAIIDAPVPVNVGVLRALKSSPLALDLYAWASFTTYQATQNGKPRFVSWKLLHDQFGAEYTRVEDFRRKVKAALARLKLAWPGLNLGERRGGIHILPGAPSVPVKSPARKVSPKPSGCAE